MEISLHDVKYVQGRKYDLIKQPGRICFEGVFDHPIFFSNLHSHRYPAVCITTANLKVALTYINFIFHSKSRIWWSITKQLPQLES